MKRSIIVCLLIVSVLQQGWAQEKPKSTRLVQFSGVVLDEDSLTPIPYVSVMVSGTKRGAVTDFYGFFNMVINPGDELEFFSITHKPAKYVTSDTMTQKYYYAIQVLRKDTITLSTVEVFPWPTRDDFKRAFLNLDLSDGDAQRADANLEREALSYLERTQTISGNEAYKQTMQARSTKLYTTGQSPSMTLMDPLRWADFIDSWRKGKFKNKK
jgi:hypothetical protein